MEKKLAKTIDDINQVNSHKDEISREISSLEQKVEATSGVPVQQPVQDLEADPVLDQQIA